MSDSNKLQFIKEQEVVSYEANYKLELLKQCSNIRWYFVQIQKNEFSSKLAFVSKRYVYAWNVFKTICTIIEARNILAQ